MTRRHANPLRLAALFAACLLLSGCDGGISGTGIPPIDAQGPTAPMAGTEPPEETAQPTAPPPDGTEPDTPPGAAPGDSGDIPDGAGATDVMSRQLANARAVRDGAPSVRLVNAASGPLAVLAGPDATLLVARLAASNEVASSVELPVDNAGDPDDAASADAAVQAPLRIESSDDGSPYAIFEPLALVDGSVTTLLARPLTDARDSVVVLETELAPPDPALSLVRIVTAIVAPGDGDDPQAAPDDADATRFEPILSDAAGERRLGTIDPAMPASDYASVPPGEYRVLDAPGARQLGTLTLRAGDVVTGVLLRGESTGGATRLLPLLDGEAVE